MNPTHESYADFDRMFAEMRDERIPFTLYGRRYSIPSELPAALVLELARREAEESLPPELLVQAAERLFGRENLKQWCLHEDFTLTRLEKMLEWAFGVCSGGELQTPVSEDDAAVSRPHSPKN